VSGLGVLLIQVMTVEFGQVGSGLMMAVRFQDSMNGRQSELSSKNAQRR
jgi:hypothetical protein